MKDDELKRKWRIFLGAPVTATTNIEVWTDAPMDREALFTLRAYLDVFEGSLPAPVQEQRGEQDA